MRQGVQVLRMAGVALAMGVTLALCCGEAFAGAIFLAGSLGEDLKFTPDSNVKEAFYSILYSTADLRVSNGVARVTIEETVIGPEDKPATCAALIPLPVGADVRGATVRLRHNDEWVPVKTIRLTAERATKTMAGLARHSGRAGILAYSGQPALLIEKMTLDRCREMQITLTIDVSEKNGIRMLECPMPADGFAKGPAKQIRLTAKIMDRLPLRSIFSPTHECEISRDGLRSATVQMKSEVGSGGIDFQLCYVADEDPMGLRMMTYRRADEEEGFFLLFGNPTGTEHDTDTAAKDVLFVLDASGSMRGEKMEQARTAIEYCLERLNPRDRFNIVTFGTEVSRFRDGSVKRSQRQIEDAVTFIDEVVPTGRTNIGDALAAGLEGLADENRVRMMIFLTDGAPTAGERDPKKIMQALKEHPRHNARIFVVGLGHDVNVHLLDGIAELTRGSSEYVGPEEEIDVKVAALFNRVSHPFLDNITVDFGGLEVSSVFPSEHRPLFRGSEVIIAGRFKGSGEHNIRICGDLHGKAREYNCTAAPAKETSETCAFVAPLWAARKIGFFLQEIRLHGENDELVQEVVRLSRAYGIVTEYTSFLADAGALAMNDREAAAEASRRMRRANREQTGQWAFNQACNDKALQQRVVAVNAAANSYVDRQGEVRDAANVRQVDGDAFYLQDGRWVQSGEKGERKVRVVKQFSDEYFELVNSNARFAKAQALDAMVTINIGNEIVEVR